VNQYRPQDSSYSDRDSIQTLLYISLRTLPLLVSCLLEGILEEMVVVCVCVLFVLNDRIGNEVKLPILLSVAYVFVVACNIWDFVFAMNLKGFYTLIIFILWTNILNTRWIKS
jgi:hypothetical protein